MNKKAVSSGKDYYMYHGFDNQSRQHGGRGNFLSVKPNMSERP